VKVLTLPLARVDAASARSRLLAIDLGSQHFHYLAGQALMMGPHGAAVRRPFSIACSPERAAETHALELPIALEGGSEDLTWATTGALVDVEGPIGSFTFPPAVEQTAVLFVAGGTGIAPVRAMLDHVLRCHPSEHVSLLYSTRRSDEFAFVDELRAHQRTGRLELHQTVTRDDGTSWDGRRGRIGRIHFEAVLHDPKTTLCFVCGPPALVSDSVATLRELGVPEHLIRTEGWESAKLEARSAK
jgi:NAD(P)H-flavin reductase